MESLTLLPWNISLLIFLKQALLLVAMISTVTGVSLFCIFFFFFLFFFFIFLFAYPLRFRLICYFPFQLWFPLIYHHIFSWQALAALGLKTGGTVQQRAERLFLTKVIVFSFFHLYRKSKLCSASLSNLRLRIKWIKFIEKTLYSNHGHSL